MRSFPWWYIVLVTMAITALLPVPATAGRVELRNEISGLRGRKNKLALRCWSNEDDLGWTVLKPGEARTWKFTTMNIWPFKKTEFRCQFRSGFGTTKEDTMTVFSVSDEMREQCTDGDYCLWVAKTDGLYQRKIAKDGVNDDVLRSKWIWKW